MVIIWTDRYSQKLTNIIAGLFITKDKIQDVQNLCEINIKLIFYESLVLIVFVDGSLYAVHAAKRIEYILEGNLLEKSVKRPFCSTVSIHTLQTMIFRSNYNSIDVFLFT